MPRLANLKFPTHSHTAAILGATITSWKNKYISTEQQFCMLHLAKLTETNGVMTFTSSKSQSFRQSSPLSQEIQSYFVKRKKKRRYWNVFLPKCTSKQKYRNFLFVRKFLLGKRLQICSTQTTVNNHWQKNDALVLRGIFKKKQNLMALPNK